MKIKILATLLGISMLLNAAGIVFFICFLNVNGKYHKLRRERNVMAQNLNAIRAHEILSEAEESHRLVNRSFASTADGQEDRYALLAPATPGGMENTLVVYLHGMGSNYLEPFVCPEGETIAQGISNRYPDACILSCSYRKLQSWGSDLAMGDITQNIRAILQEFPIKRIVMMGTSMGGCTALTYSTQAPPDIKEKITGIVSVEGAGSLSDLCDATGSDHVKLAIMAALGGTFQQVPKEYERKSFLPNIASLPPNVRIACVQAKNDRIVPPQLQDRIVSALKENHVPVKLIPIEAEHGAPPAPIYVEGLDFALGH